MERHLQDFIENLATNAYEQESVQASLDICSAYINQLEINHLQPSMDGQHGKQEGMGMRLLRNKNTNLFICTHI